MCKALNASKLPSLALFPPLLSPPQAVPPPSPVQWPLYTSIFQLSFHPRLVSCQIQRDSCLSMNLNISPPFLPIFLFWYFRCEQMVSSSPQLLRPKCCHLFSSVPTNNQMSLLIMLNISWIQRFLSNSFATVIVWDTTMPLKGPLCWSPRCCYSICTQKTIQRQSQLYPPLVCDDINLLTNSRLLNLLCKALHYLTPSDFLMSLRNPCINLYDLFLNRTKLTLISSYCLFAFCTSTTIPLINSCSSLKTQFKYHSYFPSFSFF